MPQQLSRFYNVLTLEERPRSADLLEETRQLFHHEGSDAELIELIQKAIDALHELCEASR